jgi:hypothetical protein
VDNRCVPASPSPPFMVGVEGHDARSSSRAVSRSSIRSVVRLGPATGIRARKPRLLPHAREKLDDPRFQAKITSPSRLPLSRSRARHVVDPKVAARGRAGELKTPCRARYREPVARLSLDSTLDAFCIRRRPWARHSTAHPLRPHGALFHGLIEIIPRRLRRVENETPVFLSKGVQIHSPSLSLARWEIAL